MARVLKQPRNRVYFCSNCGKTPPGTMTEQRDALTVKRVVFVEMGEGSRTVRSRVVAWLCESCLSKDEQFNLTERQGYHTPEYTPRSID